MIRKFKLLRRASVVAQGEASSSGLQFEPEHSATDTPPSAAQDSAAPAAQPSSTVQSDVRIISVCVCVEEWFRHVARVFFADVVRPG